MEKKIGQEELTKALTALQDLAKGSAGGSAPSTMVATEVAESGSTQLFHTPSNSDPGTWAGTGEEHEAWMDHVDANGTDYKSAGKKMAKSIKAKLEKGESLSKNEAMFIAKGGMKPKFLKDKDEKPVEKAGPGPVDVAVKAMDAKKEDHDDEAEDKKLVKEMVKPGAVKKSLADYAQEDATVQHGLEVSEFLSHFAGVMHKSLVALEQRVAERVEATVSKAQSADAEVQKAMAEALGNLGEVLTVHAQRLEQIEAGPARAPKSQLVKSQGDAGPATGEALNKSQALAAMVDMVQKGELSGADVVKYESTGEMTRATEAKVRRVLGASN